MRIEPTPFWERIPEIFSYPLKGNGIFALVGLTFFSLTMKLLPGFGGLLTTGLTFTFLFNVIKATGQGKKDIPSFSEYFDYWDNIVLPNIRGTLTYAITILPLAIYVVFLLKDRSALTAWDLQTFLKLLSNPLFVILFFLGIFYFPMATCLAAINENVFHMLNPLIGLNLIRKTFSSYSLLFLFVCIFTGLNIGASIILDSVFTALHFPSVGYFFKVFSGLYFSTISAATMGFWVFQNGETLGYLDASYYESQPKFIPYSGQTAEPKFFSPQSNTDLLFDEISLAENKIKEGKESEGEQIYRDLHLRFPEDDRPAQALFDFALSREERAKIAMYGEVLLESQIKSGDLAKAIAIYKKMVPFGPRLEIGAQTLLETAKLFYRQKAYGFAAKAYMHLGFLYPADPKSVKGLLMLGDLYLEKFKMPEKAVQLFEMLATLHDNSVFSPQISAGLKAARSAAVPKK